MVDLNDTDDGEPSLRVLVADDELLARRRLTRLVGAMPGVELVGECERGDEVLARAREADVLLLDVQMPGLTGLEALQLLGEDGPYVVLCTAHAEHALSAFEAGASDYLLKPIEASRLAKALQRARSRAQVRSVERAGSPAFQRLALRGARGIVLVDPHEISHLVIDGALTALHTSSGVFLSELPLAALHGRLPADRFCRAHRRAIINLGHVERLEEDTPGRLCARMRDGSAIAVSRQAARALRRRLGL